MKNWRSLLQTLGLPSKKLENRWDWLYPKLLKIRFKPATEGSKVRCRESKNSLAGWSIDRICWRWRSNSRTCSTLHQNEDLLIFKPVWCLPTPGWGDNFFTLGSCKPKRNPTLRAGFVCMLSQRDPALACHVIGWSFRLFPAQLEAYQVGFYFASRKRKAQTQIKNYFRTNFYSQPRRICLGGPIHRGVSLNTRRWYNEMGIVV